MKYNKKYGRCVMTVDVLIPVYKPDRRFARLLQMLKKQTVVPDRIIIMNTEKPTGMRKATGIFREWRSII